jgi:hypothetical protein
LQVLKQALTRFTPVITRSAQAGRVFCRSTLLALERHNIALKSYDHHPIAAFSLLRNHITCEREISDRKQREDKRWLVLRVWEL